MIDFAKSLKSPALGPARDYWNSKTPYVFTPRELAVINRFFTNSDKKVFFIRFLPPAVSTTLLAMYSRLENQRGIRGHFVDKLLPVMLASFMEKFRDDEDAKKIEDFIRDNKLSSLDIFCAFSEETEEIFHDFLESSVRPKFFQKIASSPKINKFLGMWLDKYGHNSIARTGQEVFCVEGCSLLTAKSLEWVRPAAGYIELSTRFVSMSSAGLYPFWADMSAMGYQQDAILSSRHLAHNLLEEYRSRMQDDSSPNSLSLFFREKYGEVFEAKDLGKGIKGEVCDVLGNFLPAATLTSVGIAVSGESLSGVIKCLILDETPENYALAEIIMAEGEKTGANQFLRHFEPTEWEKEFWNYLPIPEELMSLEDPRSRIISLNGPDEKSVRETIKMARRGYEGDIFNPSATRGEFDRLPAYYEYVSFWGEGVMTFRGWRDLHRQGFCTHHRSFLTPLIGFYQYDKPAPAELNQAFLGVRAKCSIVWNTMGQFYPAMPQYPMALGNLVLLQAGANLRQWEFCTWQRTKPDVNHEVRQVFLSAEELLRNQLPWWKNLSRANMTPGYVFARTEKKVPL